MDAVQRERHQAYEYGYLRTNPQIIVNPGPYIEILPANPAFIVVPYYNPLIVFAPPRPGFFIGGAIGFRFGITIGAAFAPWGWGVSRFAWGDHRVFINNARWDRTWVNRGTYVHPYAVPRYTGPRPAERHELEGRSRTRAPSRAERPGASGRAPAVASPFRGVKSPGAPKVPAGQHFARKRFSWADKLSGP